MSSVERLLLGIDVGTTAIEVALSELRPFERRSNSAIGLRCPYPRERVVSGITHKMRQRFPDLGIRLV